MAVGGATLSRGAGRISRRLDRLGEKQFALLVSIPGLLLIALIVLPPTLAVFGLSLYRIELAKDDVVRFIGLNNYTVRLPADREVLDAIPRTLFFAALTTAVTLPLALVRALVLNRPFRGRGMFFLAVLVPWAIAPVVAGMFWQFMFDTHFGMVNGILITLGVIGETDQLAPGHDPGRGDRDRRPGVALRTAARRPVAGRPADDPGGALPRGADGRRHSLESFRHITVPAIRPTLIVVAILQVIIGLQVFDLLYTLTSGGPGRTTYVLIYAIYELAFGDVSLGYASAVTVLLFFVIVACSLLLLLVQVRRRRRAGRGGRRRGRGRGRRARARPPGQRSAAPSIARRKSRGGGSALPAGARRVLFGVGVAVLLVFFLAPVVWIAVASVQTEDALKTMPPALSLNPWLDGYGIAARARELAGLVLREPLTAVLTAFFTIVICAPAAYSLARFRIPGRRTILDGLIVAADGAGDRDGDPGAPDLPDPGPEGHGRLAGDRQRRVLDPADHLAAAELLRRRPDHARARGADRRLLAPRDPVPGHDPGRQARHRRRR